MLSPTGDFDEEDLKWVQASIFLKTPQIQTTCPSIGDWIHRVWFIHTMEGDSAIKKEKAGYSQ